MKIKETLYAPFRKWAEYGPIWIYSDTHFDDPDVKYTVDGDEQVKRINAHVGRKDTIVFLGDIGNTEYVKKIKGYKVLIKGNHDAGNANYENLFNEVYGGPLFIAEKVLLSHEPIKGPWINIHGHEHTSSDPYCMCANLINYTPLRLDELLEGNIGKVEGIHRKTIDHATARKKARKQR